MVAKKYFTVLFFSIIAAFCLSAQDLVIPLYEEGEIPCANNHEIEIVDDENIRSRISKVHAPDIAVYKADDPNGAAILICPGGGYTILAYDWEGTEFAEWFNELGITAIVLKYRLPHWESAECRDKVALPDAKRAMQLIRRNAEEWRIDADRIGVMGFSAGGHLASTLSTQFDIGNVSDTNALAKFSSRPDFSILVYPVITMDPNVTHGGSKTNLIGENPRQEDLVRFSSELQVTDNTPPTILVHASDDKAVPVENSIRYYQALLSNGVSASMMVYPSGGHGFAFAKNKEGSVKAWATDLMAWMIEQSIIP